MNKKVKMRMNERKELIEKNAKLSIMLVLLAISIFSSATIISSASYSRSNPAYTQTTFLAQTGTVDFPFMFNREMCAAGQDFVLQVSPTGCIPSVVRSDLLEEQNVPVFCPIIGTQVNPLVDVKTINNIRFSYNGNAPEEVQGLTYMPARAALGSQLGGLFGGSNVQMNQPALNSMGYAVIVLKRQQNESKMPDFVQGNLTATLMYDVENAFGVGKQTYYLPEINDEDQWNENYVRYGFWQGRGYLRAEGIGDDSAFISVYSDREAYSTAKSGEKRKVASSNVGVGKNLTTSMPGFNYCLGEMIVKLEGLENPETRAVLRINEDNFEYKQGEKFLEDKCKITDMVKYGLVQKIKVSCTQDETEKSSPSNLIISPRVNLEIDGITNSEGYNVGDLLYTYEAKDDEGNLVPEKNKNVYLGFIESKKGTNNEEDLYVNLVAIPVKDRTISLLNKMTDSEISSVAGYYKGGFGKVLASAKKIQGWEFSEDKISYEELKSLYGKNVKLMGFEDAVNGELPSSTDEERILKDNYLQAMKDYETVKKDFFIETYPTGDEIMLGEKALLNAADLAWRTNQKKTALELCNELYESYPNSVAPPICEDAVKLSSVESDSMDVLINGRNYLIVFDGIEEPGSEDYSVNMFISGTSEPYGGNIESIRKNEIISLSETEYFSLKDLENDYAKFDVSNIERGKVDSIQNELQIDLDSPKTVGKYSITVTKINLKKMAKVSINPRIDFQQSKANVSFKIGIEKRGIQLSPEKTKERIESLNETLKKWRGINDKLSTIVRVEKTACLGVGTALTFKNFLANLGGQGIARQKVMRSSGGWFDMCQNEVKAEMYNSVDSCLTDKSPEIEASVNVVSEAMKQQDAELKQIQESVGAASNTFLGEKVYDTEKITGEFIAEHNNEIFSNIKGAGVNTITVGNQEIPVSQIIDSINSESVYLSQAKNLQLNSRLMNQPGVVGEIARAEVNKDLADIWVNNRLIVEQENFVKEVSSSAATLFSSEELKEIPVTTVDTWGQVKTEYKGVTMDDSSSVYFLKDRTNGQKYLLVLDNDYVITRTYKIDSLGTLSLLSDTKQNPLNLAIKKSDASAYNNPYPTGTAQIRYFETDPYKGLPAVVPFDLEHGWYVTMKSVLPIGGGIQPYDDSGRVSNFWICNIGENKKEEGIGVVDDQCQGFVPRASQPPAFYGLSISEAQALTSKAEQAIIVASQARARDSGVNQVKIGTQTIKVGMPAADIPDIQCQDFMSPADCNLLFNVCDPVVCPSSRCDFGGTYPVRDVVQSGVIGSLLLCSQNFPDVKIPVCLSGVNAGLQGYLSVLDSYQQCLQTSLDTGQTVGVCDEINSIYMCDFFWRQSLPLAKIVVPKVIGSVLGQNTRGGGEYLGVQDAWNKAGDSVDYFTQYYAENSYQAFKLRTLEDAGTEVCKNWISFTGPDGGSLLDAITTPDVPVQFYGRFDEIPYTTVTNPPISQYKVFYHIFAGEDFPAYYQVYLKGESGTFFQDTNIRRVVDSGFIKKGEYATQTKDFTAPSGYKQLCIVVNNQEECGFKQVTTEFGVNYLTEQAVASQAGQTDITSESACISGTPSLLSLSPNLQATAEGLLNPAIYNSGITRICATKNPGAGTDASSGTDSSRWREVGYCGNTNLKCWLDTQSVTDTIKSTTLEDKALGEVSSDDLDSLENAELSENEFADVLKNIEGADTPVKKLALLAASYNRVSSNDKKGYLTLLRADAYKEIALLAYQSWRGLEDKRLESLCGNNIIDTGETCDDGNKVPGDGCSDICKIENPELPGTIPSDALTPIPRIDDNTQNAIEKSDTSNLQYPVFKFDNGKIGGDIYYTYSDGQWFWGESKDRLISSNIESFASSIIPNDKLAQADVTYITQDNDIFNRQSNENKDFIKSLVDKSYRDGLNLLIRFTEKNDGAGWFAVKSKLSTGGVEFGPDDVFVIKSVPSINSMGYAFEYSLSARIWKWTPSYEGQESPQEVLNLVNNLKGKLFLEGAETIFGIDTSDREDILSSTGTSGTTTGGTSGTGTSTGTSTGTGATTSELTCTTTEDCQKVLGKRIMELAAAKKTSDPKFNDAVIQRDIGVKNFECLVLMVAGGESSILHCNPIQENENPLYCEERTSNVIGGDATQGGSMGVMQINKKAHPNAFPGVYNFEENVNYGINLLVSGYFSESKVYSCYRSSSFTGPVRESDFSKVSYPGWKRALRNYNGWNSQCYTTKDDGTLTELGNPRYVDYILSMKNGVIALFPECNPNS